MKRFLCALLCAVLMLGLLPAVSPPARMDITSASCSVNKTAAFVGDTITWTVYDVVGDGPYVYKFRIFLNGSFYLEDPGIYADENSRSFKPYEPGTYFPFIHVLEQHTGTVYFFDGPSTVVSLRPAPNITGIEAVSASSLSIGWDPVTDASGYEVWRSGSAAGLYTLAGTTATTGFTDTSLTPGTSYFYKVRTYNDVDGVDYPSGEFSVAEAGLIKADSPKVRPATKITKIETKSGTSLKITWNKIIGADGYFLERSTGKTGPYKLVKTTTAMSFTDTSLKAGTRYYYRVRAYNLVDGTKMISGKYSTAAAGVPLAKCAITKVSGVSASQIKLIWKKAAGATGYEVFRSSSKTGAFTAIRKINALSMIVTGMEPGNTYYFKVMAYKKINTATYYGPMSGYRSGRTLAE